MPTEGSVIIFRQFHEYTSSLRANSRGIDMKSTKTIMAGVNHVIEPRKAPCALYSDRASLFVHILQVGQAVEQPGFESIAAYGSEAGGRRERQFGI